MKTMLFSVRDVHSGFQYPTADVNENTAMRNFRAAINNATPVSGLAFAPQDFDLYHVGFFDTAKGIFEPTDSGLPELILSGSSAFLKEVT